MTTVNPSKEQRAIRDAADLSLVITAPAGCGKTEALGLRARGLVDRGAITVPRRLLLVTFSNRARDNARERLRAYLSAQEMRELVSVTNFHGLAARIFRAHADTVQLDPKMTQPEADWVAAQARARKLTFPQSMEVQRVLREVKQRCLDDSGVERELLETGSQVALDIERQRISENRLTYDDLLRLAEQILLNEQVAQLYSNHFAAVMVDEYQDLTPQQLRVIRRIGYGRTTYAGDLAQGIYRFAGASPDEVHADIQGECSTKVDLAESHRSSPAVLGLVNAVTPLTGGVSLKAAHPGSWPHGGLAGGIRFDDVEAEAAWTVRLCRRILTQAPNQRIGIITRTRPRRRFHDRHLEESELAVHRWEDGILDTQTAGIVKHFLSRLSIADFQAATDSVQYARAAVDFESLQDSNDRTALADALNWCCDLLREGHSPASIRSRIRVGDDSMLLNLPGVHMLTGHTGKGQQFDWVVIPGLEEGTMPDFRQTDSTYALAEEVRILSVMMSRARHGLVLTFANAVPTNSGAIRNRQPSRFWTPLGVHGWKSRSEVEAWIKNADWHSIASR